MSNESLSSVQFGHTTTDFEHQVHARIGQEQVGQLDLDKNVGVVNDVYVKEEHQNKGIATGMWKYAQKAGLNPAHSDTRSESGDIWAESLYRKGLAPKPEPTDSEEHW